MGVLGGIFTSSPAPRAGSRPEAVLLGFARALRAAGVNVTADRERTYLQAAAQVGLADPTGVFWAGRATLCASPDDLRRHDQVFTAWFGQQPTGPRQRRSAVAHPQAATAMEMAHPMMLTPVLMNTARPKMASAPLPTVMLEQMTIALFSKFHPLGWTLGFR